MLRNLGTKTPSNKIPFPSNIFLSKIEAYFLSSKKNSIHYFLISISRKIYTCKKIIKILKNKIYKYRIVISKNVHIDKLDNTVDKYHNIYYRTIKINIYNLLDLKEDNHTAKYNIATKSKKLFKSMLASLCKVFVPNINCFGYRIGIQFSKTLLVIGKTK